MSDTNLLIFFYSSVSTDTIDDLLDSIEEIGSKLSA